MSSQKLERKKIDCTPSIFEFRGPHNAGTTWPRVWRATTSHYSFGAKFTTGQDTAQEHMNIPIIDIWHWCFRSLQQKREAFTFVPIWSCISIRNKWYDQCVWHCLLIHRLTSVQCSRQLLSPICYNSTTRPLLVTRTFSFHEKRTIEETKLPKKWIIKTLKEWK